jgi:hypothetical protein
LKYLFKRYEKMIAEEETQGTLFAKEIKNEVEEKNIIIYNTSDGQAAVSLYAKDGIIWMNQAELAQLFDTSKQNIGQHIYNILEDKEFVEKSVVKDYLITDFLTVLVDFYKFSVRKLNNSNAFFIFTPKSDKLLPFNVLFNPIRFKKCRYRNANFVEFNCCFFC